jgi:hypothetical protein
VGCIFNSLGRIITVNHFKKSVSPKKKLFAMDIQKNGHAKKSSTSNFLLVFNSFFLFSFLTSDIMTFLVSDITIKSKVKKEKFSALQ